MKPLPLVLFAITIHLLIKFFWDFVGDNLYYTGMAAVMVLWVIAFKVKKESSKLLNIIVNFWLVWVTNDLLKEVCHAFNIFQWLFANPTVKDLNEYIAFFISIIVVWWQIRRLKRAK